MVRPIAIYLPQFHPVKENDEWWGKGFTEWTNVAKAKSLFKEHYQPHLPADLGFYDLRLNEVVREQAEMAKQYGIYGFCFYHYWFNGKLILERPLEEMLAKGTPDFPFCLSWANENWTRVWDGSDKQVLLEQKYSLEDDAEHMRYLARFMRDPRYIKVNGKPFLNVYKIQEIPDIAATVNVWRKVAKEEGLGEIYITCMERGQNLYPDFEKTGLDAVVDFQPDNSSPYLKRSLFWFYMQKYKMSPRAYIDNFVLDYREYAQSVLNRPPAAYKKYPGITPMWDNSARRKQNAHIYIHSSPEAYKEWLEKTLEKFTPFSREENFVFINAWNEWAEGNHLEPCQKWGHQYLKATQDALLRKG